jgi:hypothetical protein
MVLLGGIGAAERNSTGHSSEVDHDIASLHNLPATIQRPQIVFA